MNAGVLNTPAGLRRAACSAAEGVTEVVLAGFAECGQVTLKRDAHDVVTEFDLRAELAIHTRLRELVPGCGFVGEETGEHPAEGSVVWHVDPIDGTSNYASGVPLWSVSIAAVVAGEVVAGAVWDPIRSEMFSADEDGAYLGAEPIHAWAPESSRDGVLLTCYPDVADLDLDGPATCYARHERLQRAFRAVRGLGSSALQLAWLAAGRMAATVVTHQETWDVAAGCLLVERAGGSVRGVSQDGVASARRAYQQPIVIAQGSGEPYPVLAELWA